MERYKVREKTRMYALSTALRVYIKSRKLNLWARSVKFINVVFPSFAL